MPYAGYLRTTMNRQLPADQRSFAILVTSVTACLGLVAALVVELARHDSASHVAGLVTRLCTSIAHIAMDVASLMLATLPLAVLFLLALFAFSIHRRTSLLVNTISADRLPVLPAHVRTAAAGAGVEESVVVVECPDLLLFVHGCLQPKIVVSTGVIDALTADELLSVLCHEAHHLRRGDPLRIYMAEVAARSLCMFPVIRDLRNHFATVTEIAADRRAIAHTNRRTLASAVLKFSDAPQLAGTTGINGEAQTHARLAALLDPDLPYPKVTVAPSSLAITVLVVATACLLVAMLERLPAM